MPQGHFPCGPARALSLVLVALSHLLTLSVVSELRSALTCIAGISVYLVLLLSHLHLTILFLFLLALAQHPALGRSL